MFGAKVFCVGQCSASCLGFVSEQRLINYFGNIWVLLKRPLKWLTAAVLKKSGCSTAADVWCQLTVDEAGLVAADVLTVRQWLLEKKRLVLVWLQV